jgi:hypothetical protein
MSTDFITFTLQQVCISLAEATYDAGLTRSPDTVPLIAARRLRAHVKQLAIILRRLTMLMALSLTLDPIRARKRPEGPEDDDPVITKAQISFSIALSGQTQVYALDGHGFPEGASSASGPVPVACLMRRFEVLGAYPAPSGKICPARRARHGTPPPGRGAASARRVHPDLSSET